MAGPVAGPIVGFDLDMTLIDSRPGIATTLRAIAAETGVPIDAELVVGRLGPMLEEEMALWFPEAEVAAVCDRYRELYAELGVTGTDLLPGAAEAVAAVRSAGGRSVVVTAKHGPNAHLCLAHVGVEVDVVVGSRHGPGKTDALVEQGTDVYVGDTPPDMVAARAAGAVAVGVTTGPHAAGALVEAGADVVLESLTRFPQWLRAWRRAGAGGAA